MTSSNAYETPKYSGSLTDERSILALLEALQPVQIGTLLAAEIEENATQRGCLSDSLVLGKCVSKAIIDSVNEAKLSKLYLSSFILRHAAVWLALACERMNQEQQNSVIQGQTKSPCLESETEKFVLDNSKTFRGMHFSLSARGIEWILKPLSQCSFFDPYQPLSEAQCGLLPTRAGGLCNSPASSDWLKAVSPSQATAEDLTPQNYTGLGLRNQVTARHQTMMIF